MSELNDLERALVSQLVSEVEYRGRRTLSIVVDGELERFDGICDLLQRLWKDDDLNGKDHLFRVTAALDSWLEESQQWQDADTQARDDAYDALPGALRTFLRSSAASSVFSPGYVRPFVIASELVRWWRHSIFFDRRGKLEARKALQAAAALAAQEAAQTVAAE